MPLLPDRSREQIIAAAARFDATERATYPFGSQSFALIINGSLYPPKRIVSLATGVDYRMFSGGKPTNSYLTKRGFEVVDLRAEGEAAVVDKQDAA